MIEVDVRGRQAGVPEKALNLLQRIAKQPTVAIHPDPVASSAASRKRAESASRACARQMYAGVGEG